MTTQVSMTNQTSLRSNCTQACHKCGKKAVHVAGGNPCCPKHCDFSDTYSTVEGKMGHAHVVSATVDNKTGKRNEYDLTYCYSADRDRFLPTGCGCLGFLSAQACRHAVGLFDVLNHPFVKLHLVHTPKTELLKAEVFGLCAQCGAENLSIMLYIGGQGYLSADACLACQRTVIR